jgi:hypothetical protein
MTLILASATRNHSETNKLYFSFPFSFSFLYEDELPEVLLGEHLFFCTLYYSTCCDPFRKAAHCKWRWL